MLRIWIILVLQVLSLRVDREVMAGLLFLWWLFEMFLLVYKDIKQWGEYWKRS